MLFHLEKIEKKCEKCDIVRVEIIESITMPTSFVWAIDYYARLFPPSLENVIPSNPIFEKVSGTEAKRLQYIRKNSAWLYSLHLTL